MYFLNEDVGVWIREIGNLNDIDVRLEGKRYSPKRVKYIEHSMRAAPQISWTTQGREAETYLTLLCNFALLVLPRAIASHRLSWQQRPYKVHRRVSIHVLRTTACDKLAPKVCTSPSTQMIFSLPDQSDHTIKACIRKDKIWRQEKRKCRKEARDTQLQTRKR